MRVDLIPALSPTTPPEIVYFAHSMQIYGTVDAEATRYLIQKLIPEASILDPEMVPWKELAEQRGQDAVFRMVIKACTRVVVYEHLGHVGKGVATAVDLALRMQKPVDALRDGVLVPISGWGIVNRGDWKLKYARIFAMR